MCVIAEEPYFRENDLYGGTSRRRVGIDTFSKSSYFSYLETSKGSNQSFHIFIVSFSLMVEPGMVLSLCEGKVVRRWVWWGGKN